MRRLAVALVALLIAGCGGQTGAPSIAVGAGDDPESTLLAQLYAATLRYYGNAARRAAPAGRRSRHWRRHGGAGIHRATVEPLRSRCDGARRRAGVPVDDLSAARGIAAGDYTQSPGQTHTGGHQATARKWGGQDVTAWSGTAPGWRWAPSPTRRGFGGSRHLPPSRGANFPTGNAFASFGQAR